MNNTNDNRGQNLNDKNKMGQGKPMTDQGQKAKTDKDNLSDDKSADLKKKQDQGSTGQGQRQH